MKKEESKGENVSLENTEFIPVPHIAEELDQLGIDYKAPGFTK